MQCHHRCGIGREQKFTLSLATNRGDVDTPRAPSNTLSHKTRSRTLISLLRHLSNLIFYTYHKAVIHGFPLSHRHDTVFLIAVDIRAQWYNPKLCPVRVSILLKNEKWCTSETNSTLSRRTTSSVRSPHSFQPELLVFIVENCLSATTAVHSIRFFSNATRHVLFS